MTPKSLLRSPQAGSSLDQFTQSGFHPLIGDSVAPGGVERVIICSGKVYYDLMAEHEKSGNGHVAILRLEQFYPFPRTLLQQWLNSYTKAGEIVWAQEEPQNMGGWNFMRPRLEALAKGRTEVRYVGRSRSASPATGSYTIHQLEQARLVKEALSL
jgi:2-oxoglutarate dehydrogenase complex dehydrogenase (E1) component-like enzyme